MNVNNIMNNVLVVAFNTAGTSSLNRYIHHSTSTTRTCNYQRYLRLRRTRKGQAFSSRSATSSSSSEEEIHVSSPQSMNTISMNRSTTAKIADDTRSDTDNNDTDNNTEESIKEEIPSKKEISRISLHRPSFPGRHCILGLCRSTSSTHLV